MGRDKRVLEVAGIRLLDRALGVLEQVFAEVLIVVAEPSPEVAQLGHRVVTDLIPNCAALGGLYTGLSAASAPRVFLAACDMPFLEAEVIQVLVDRDVEADVVMAELATGLQPLHAVYSRRCLPHLEGMARRGDLALHHLVQVSGLRVRIVPEEELRRLHPQGLSFMNVNTPADLEFARKIVSARKDRGA